MKQKYEFKNVVAETLLIPLYMRAKESRRKGDAILKDTMAEQLVDSIEYDYSQFDGAKMSEVGCVVRGKYFDDAIRRFILSHPHPVVVNVGCGLDTRYQRIGNDQAAVFYELDLPEVIDLRRRRPLHRCVAPRNRMDGRTEKTTSRGAVHLRGGRRADVFLRGTGKNGFEAYRRTLQRRRIMV